MAVILEIPNLQAFTDEAEKRQIPGENLRVVNLTQVREGILRHDKARLTAFDKKADVILRCDIRYYSGFNWRNKGEPAYQKFVKANKKTKKTIEVELGFIPPDGEFHLGEAKW